MSLERSLHAGPVVPARRRPTTRLETGAESRSSTPRDRTGSTTVRNYGTFTKVDLEARCKIERVIGPSPQRIQRWGVSD
jgi:hypothetical protein